MPTSHGHNTVRIQANPRSNHVLLQTRSTNTLTSKSRKGKGLQRRYQRTNPILPTSTISQHNRDFSSLPRHHQYCPGMEENNDKFKPTSPVGIRTDTAITSTQFTPNFSISNAHTRNGTTAIPPCRSLQIPSSRYRQQTPTGR